MSSSGDKSYYTHRQTDNYKYDLNIDLQQHHGSGKYTTAHLYVGQKTDPCLSITIPLLGMIESNDRYDKNEVSIARLNKIKKLRECIRSAKPDAPSFPKEMLNDVMYIIRQNYPHIHHIQLIDDSEIPCGEQDKIGLMYYSVALYKKTWYEQSFNAYFLPRDRFVQYKCAVERYASQETKKAWDWNTFYRELRISRNDFATSTIEERLTEIEEMFKAATTFPEFFTSLSKAIKLEEKCRFFRGWLESFIESFVIVPRTWYIDLYTVQVRSSLYGGRRKTRKSRK